VIAQSNILKLDLVTSPLDGASSLSVTPAGLIFLTEKNRHRLLVVTADGERTDSLGARGSGDYRFNMPVSVDATNGLKIYVADQNNGRVQLYDRRFQYLSSVTADKIDQETRFRPSQLQISNSGDLFVYDSDLHIIYIFDPLGNYSRKIDLRSFQVGSDIHMKISGSVLLIFDSDRGIIHKFNADGGYLNFIGGFSGAIKIHGTESGLWAVFNDRVTRFNTVGEPLQTYKFEQQLMPEDLYIHQSVVYILTKDQLLSCQFE
jgi:hypothetical protein